MYGMPQKNPLTPLSPLLKGVVVVATACIERKRERRKVERQRKKYLGIYVNEREEKCLAYVRVYWYGHVSMFCNYRYYEEQTVEQIDKKIAHIRVKIQLSSTIRVYVPVYCRTTMAVVLNFTSTSTS